MMMSYLAKCLAGIIKDIAEVQGVPGEEDVDESVTLYGTELPAIDPSSICIEKDGSIVVTLIDGSRFSISISSL